MVIISLAVAVAVGVWWWRSAPDGAPIDLSTLPRAGSVTTSTPTGTADPSSADLGDAATSGSSPAGTGVTVDVAGAVVEPGVRRLAVGARVADAIAAAGGTRPEADLDRVNRAAALIDGARVWIPSRGQPDPSPVVIDPAPGAGGTPSSAPIDLNGATATQLDGLPGVGPATASAIVSYRNSHGPFTNVDELAEVRGIGPAKLETIRPLVRVGS